MKNASASFHSMQNPYLPLWEHLPDGEPRVFEDPDNPGKYRIYIVGSHDLRVSSYCGPDIRAWSAPVDDLSSWRDHGPIFTYQDPKTKLWDVMFAPDLVELRKRDGTKEYYLYPHSRGPAREPMVAKGPRPDGPFTPINLEPCGTRTVPGSVIGFDPQVCIEYITDENDPDYEIGFRAYAYWGFQRAFSAQLDQNTMYSVRPGTEVTTHSIPASSRYGEIRDPEGTRYPHVFEGEDLTGFNYFEAFSIRKIGNKYVIVFSGYSGPDYGLGSTNSALRYAYGDSPLGPWRSGGVLVDSRAPVLNRDGTALATSNAAHNTHGGLAYMNDQWYVFYHRPPRGFGGARQAMADPVWVEWDEKPVAEGGAVRIRAYDPYASDCIWTAKATNGDEYKGAQVTSEGFHMYGLDPYRYYSAGIACYLSNTETMQDSWDIWDNHMPIADVKNGHIIGYKHFGFGGLSEKKKGLLSFEGTKPGNNTKFSIFITPKTPDDFRIHVWLDGPWDNAPWNGKKIGTVSVPAGTAGDTAEFMLDVSNAVDSLDKKHAIYITAEGGEGPLFDLIGIGFGTTEKPVVRPVPPSVKIYADGKELPLPLHPIRSTDENGITDYSHYQVTAEGFEKAPVITASSSDANVKITITPNAAGTVVAFDYKGAVKNYHVGYQTQAIE